MTLEVMPCPEACCEPLLPAPWLLHRRREMARNVEGALACRAGLAAHCSGLLRSPSQRLAAPPESDSAKQSWLPFCLQASVDYV